MYKKKKKKKGIIFYCSRLSIYFHDFEEMIGFGWFFRNNPQLFKKHPTHLTAAYRGLYAGGLCLLLLADKSSRRCRL